VEDAYLVSIYNTVDQAILSYMLFFFKIILALTLFFLMRPDGTSASWEAAYFGAMDRLIANIQLQKSLIALAPSVVVPYIKESLTSTTRDILLKSYYTPSSPSQSKHAAQSVHSLCNRQKRFFEHHSVQQAQPICRVRPDLTFRHCHNTSS